MAVALVTGAAGSVGKEVVEGLVRRGWSVRGFDLPGCDFGSLESFPGVEIIRGDITDPRSVALVGQVDAIVHLAALLPPVSERDRARTFLVNVQGMQNLIRAVVEVGSEARAPHFVLASSVATYGDTSGDEPPIKVEREQRPVDIYGESKVAAEKLLIASGLSYTILRIAPVSIPAVLEPPEVWPFSPNQRVEFVARSDAVLALLNCVGNDEATDKILNIAGGPSWQVLGRQYVGNLYETLELDPREARYGDGPSWFDWYDTTESEAILAYQRTSYQDFLAQLRRAVEEEYA